MVINRKSITYFYRLGKAVDRCFIDDLAFLPFFENSESINSEVADSLETSGLIRLCGTDYGTYGDDDSVQSSYELTSLGKELLKILKDNHWDRLSSLSPKKELL